MSEEKKSPPPLPPTINATDSLLNLPSHLDAFQLAPSATTQEYTAQADKSGPSRVSSSQRAFSEAVAALSRDMPILMHGSGDVVPDQVNPATARLLSELTVRYIANLVDAALDSQQMLAGGQAATPPPPRYPRSRKPPLPHVPPKGKKKSAEEEAKERDSGVVVLKKRPRKPDVDYWDEPLPEPKIVKREKGGAPNAAAAAGPASGAADNDDEDNAGEDVHVDRWCGIAGVDLWENKARAAYVRMPDAVGVQCFIFPICHDGFLYGKVMQVQASRRAIAPVLMDSVLLDLVRTEGALAKKQPSRRKKPESKSKESGDADVEDEPEQEEEEEREEDEPGWPGLEFLLPVHAITEAIGPSGKST